MRGSKPTFAPKYTFGFDFVKEVEEAASLFPPYLLACLETDYNCLDGAPDSGLKQFVAAEHHGSFIDEAQHAGDVAQGVDFDILRELQQINGTTGLVQVGPTLNCVLLACMQFSF